MRNGWRVPSHHEDRLFWAVVHNTSRKACRVLFSGTASSSTVAAGLHFASVLVSWLHALTLIEKGMELYIRRDSVLYSCDIQLGVVRY